MTGNTCLISAPADIRSIVIEDHCIRLIFVDQLDISRKIIHLLLSVRTLAAGIVKPYIEDIAISGQKFRQLITEIIVVFRCSVILGISVPGRKIEAKFNSAPAAGLYASFNTSP